MDTIQVGRSQVQIIRRREGGRREREREREGEMEDDLQTELKARDKTKVITNYCKYQTGQFENL